MKLGGVGTAGRELRALLEGGATASLSDGQLLARFSNGRGDSSGEAAFAALVARHGPMVWGTCRRILRDSHAAEDAFQATFLILVRKAGSIRVDDSLGRWLHGVGVRVALRARANQARRSGEELAEVEAPGSTPEQGRLDLRDAIDEEVARLPSTYRSVVVLCHLEGLTRERAAGRLGCPVGTVNSRLSRAGELLRARLTRRGLAPHSAGLVAWLAPGAVPARLIGGTVAASTHLASGGSLAGMVPVGVAVLLRETIRRMTLMTLMKATVIGSTLVALGTLAASARSQEGAKGESPPAVGRTKAGVVEAPIPPTLTERAKAIKAEWEAACKACFDEMDKVKTKAEQNELFGKLYPKELDYFQRALDLADSNPKDPGARDAWLWVISEGMRNNDAIGPRAVPIGKAVDGLIAHHADDPKVARTALNIDNCPSANRARLTRGLFEKATSHETKGVAALALAMYLQMEASTVRWAHNAPEQPKMKHQSYDDEGRIKLIEGRKQYDDGYWEQLKKQDESAMRVESEDLYNRAIAEYADVPLSRKHYVDGKLVDNPHPKSLADHARAKLDDLYNLAVGKPAPEVEGVDLDGKPLKLSDYKGKVVALVFWYSGCGPCMAAVPHERELLERLKGKPFAILGINSDEKPEAAHKAVETANMTWPSWQDGREGSITTRFHIRGFPTTFVIDAKGIIRQKKADGGSLDKVVEDLLSEMEAKPPKAN